LHIPSPRSSQSHLEAFSSWRSALCPSAPSLRAYFTSGWAFFIPYLAAYLLYAWLKWPANSSAHSALGHGGYIPALLHVYWALHVINVVLAVIALRSWWCKAKREAQRAESDLPPATGSSPAPLHPLLSALGSSTASLPPALGPSPAPSAPLHSSPLALRRMAIGSSSAFSFQPSAFSAALRAVAPWLFLTLIFAIPGVYLEWPSDPWEHLRRITEWNTHPLVGSHSAGYKSFYFFAYSWVGWLVPTHLLSWLNVYYANVCLLLAWQYYRLAKTVGLDRRWAFLFVIVNALTFGNSCFSFYRYYGLSTSIYAQLGAVALTRIVLEWAKSEGRRAKGKGRGAWSEEERGKRETVTTTSEEQRAEGGKPLRPWRLPLTALPAAIGRFALCALLLAFIAFNHVQGIGIAGLSIMAAIIWRVFKWKTAVFGWLVGLTLAANLFFLWLYPRPVIIENFRSEGILNTWYGFNILDLSSVAGNRMLQIVSAFGLINLVAACLLLSRNRVVAWLTIIPLVMLLLPLIAIPLAQVLATHGGPGNVITFQRMLFAVPFCLALVTLSSEWRTKRVTKHSKPIGQSTSATTTLGRSSKPAPAHARSKNDAFLGFGFGCLAIVALMVVPGSSACFNRMWNTLAIVPNDLQLRHFVVRWTPEAITQAEDENTLTINAPLASEVQEVFMPSPRWAEFRQVYAPLDSTQLEQRLAWLDSLSAVSSWIQATKIKDPSAQPDQVLLDRRNAPASSAPAIDLTASKNPWLQLGGHSVARQKFVRGRLTLSNPVGMESNPLGPNFIPVSHHKRYQLTSTIRQTGEPSAINYLAVVWYDQEGNILTSNLPPPQGAGNPRGWQNGTYSYYGLVAQSAKPVWTSYSISFGFGEPVDIPTNAAYLRAGALLNYRGTPETLVELTDVVLTEKPAYEHLLFVAPGFRNLTTPASTAARLSQHWGPQHVSMDDAGTEELRQRFSKIIKVPEKEN
jgi:hypothetical protein